MPYDSIPGSTDPDVLDGGVYSPLPNDPAVLINASAAASASAAAASAAAAAAAVLGALLAGLAISPNSPILATDTVLVAFGKLQAQINALSGGVIPGVLWAGDVSWDTGVLWL